MFGGSYEEHKNYVNAQRKEKTRLGQDIGEIPECKNPDRREEARHSLRRHLEIYKSDLCCGNWGTYHLILIERLEQAILNGGWFALAVPRGGGKTTISLGACEWAILHGYKKWPRLIGATQPSADQLLKNIKTVLRTNQGYIDDFPETTYPIVKLDNQPRRAEGQRYKGELTGAIWGKNKIGFATVGGPSDGCRIDALGLTGHIRGAVDVVERIVDGKRVTESIRPDLCIADDPQTAESARSWQQSNDRKNLLTSDVAFLNGPTEKMSVIVPCTVVCKSDLAEQILDRSSNPEWHGERHKMLISFPSNLEWWDQYAERRRELLRQDKPLDELNEMYARDQAIADVGAEVSWDHRKKADEVSAIQHAMNLWLRNPVSFAAEMQNDPELAQGDDAIICPANQIIVKQSHLGKWEVPIEAEKIVAHIDVQQDILFWSVLATSKWFEGTIIAYGSFPDQQRSMYSTKDDLRGLARLWPKDRIESRIFRAINEFGKELFEREFRREDGLLMHLDRMLVDCGFMRDVVNKACRALGPKAMPARGIGVGAKDDPWVEKKAKPGEILGHHWHIKPTPEKDQLYVQTDVNYWKTQAHIGFLTPSGIGSLSLYKETPERHRMFADHCASSEYPQRLKSEKKNNQVDEWFALPGAPDNHHFDNVVGCLAAASIEGCIFKDSHEEAPSSRRRVRKVITSQSQAKR